MTLLLLCRHLARNPFICDCNLRWLSEYLQSHPIETSGARCDSPRRMQRKKIGLVKNDKFRCKGKLYRIRRSSFHHQFMAWPV